MKVVGYARVSTRRQSTYTQAEDIAAYCVKHGHELVKTFEEVVSGFTWVENRVAGKALLDGLPEEIEGVVVTWRDRWTRAVDDPQGEYSGLIVINAEREGVQEDQIIHAVVVELRRRGWTVEPPEDDDG